MAMNIPHTFHCPHCNQDVTVGIINDDDIPPAQEFHMEECRLGPVHRYVDFEVSSRDRGEASCQDQSEQRRSLMPSSITCPACLGQTPGLQLRGMLETVSRPGNAERVDAPESVRNALAEIWQELQ